ncbi:RNA-directed DNA polymerase, eukaryota, reverse transcriptase zinc-binding domain protein, partial [Tanacetum coccineum]
HAFMVWLAIRGRLKTQDLMGVWEKKDDMRCVFCKNVPDSHDHLFFECSFTRRIWDSLKCMERNIRMFQDKARYVDTLVDLIKDTVRLRVMSLSLNDSAQVSEAANLWNFHVDRVLLVLWDSVAMVWVFNVKGMEVWIAFTSFVIGPWAMCDPSILMASYLVLSWVVLYMHNVVPISDYKNESCSFEKLDQGTFVKMETNCFVYFIICRFNCRKFGHCRALLLLVMFPKHVLGMSCYFDLYGSVHMKSCL